MNALDIIVDAPAGLTTKILQVELVWVRKPSRNKDIIANLVLPVAPPISGEEHVPFSAFLANYSPHWKSEEVSDAISSTFCADISSHMCVYPNAL